MSVIRDFPRDIRTLISPMTNFAKECNSSSYLQCTEVKLVIVNQLTFSGVIYEETVSNKRVGHVKNANLIIRNVISIFLVIKLIVASQQTRSLKKLRKCLHQNHR